MPRETQSDPLTEAWTRTTSAALLAAADFWGRSLEIVARAVSHANTPGASRGAQRTLADWRHLLTELAMVPGLAIERFGSALTAPASTAASDPRRVVDGRTVLLPARTFDASHGFAVYPVSRRAAQTILDARLGGHFVAIDIGHERAAVQIDVIDYRLSDLGTYRELSLAVIAAPRRDASTLGVCVVDEIVNEPFACRAGAAIWGYPKRLGVLTFSRRGERFTCEVTTEAAGLHVELPTGGTGSSVRIPYRFYSMLDGRPHGSCLIRTAHGERVRAGGGGITIRLSGGSTDRVGQPVAAPRPVDPLARMLDDLDVERIRPMLHGWAEYVSGESTAPEPI